MKEGRLFKKLWNLFLSKLRGLNEILFFDNRLQLIMNRIFFCDTPLAVYRTHGLQFLVDHSADDANGVRNLLASNMYKKLLHGLSLNSALNVIDFGANSGGFPLMLTRQQYQIKNLACVEMNPHTFSRLQFNMYQNIHGHKKLFNAALCGQERNIPLSLGKGDTGDNIYSESLNSTGKKYQIEGKTFDYFFKQWDCQFSVDLCKMDIEGAEYEVFESDTWGCLKNCKYLVMEIHQMPGKTPKEITQILIKNGFVLVKNDSSFPDVFLFKNNLLAQS